MDPSFNPKNTFLPFLFKQVNLSFFSSSSFHPLTLSITVITAGNKERVCVCVCVRASARTHARAQSCPKSLRPHGLQPTRLLCPWDFPGKNTGVGCHVILQGIFLISGLNLRLLCLLHCRQVLYHWHQLGSPGVWILTSYYKTSVK